PKIPFRAPAGIRMVRIDRASGKPVFGTWPTDDPKASVIWEAFKPESEPRRVVHRDVIVPDSAAAAAAAAAKARADAQAPKDT
ncbi:hypothetical protein, partial [Escherichia coli]|uniref:hypothetical protein n=1 Tax=Escherichia coli TaxID=562 RepID=UPI003D359D9A